MKRLKNKGGFTLIEVVVVMAIIAVLAVLVIGAITIARNTAKETTHRSNARTIQTGLEGFYAKNKSYVGTDAGTNDAGTYSFTNAAVKNYLDVSLATTGECTGKVIGADASAIPPVAGNASDGGGYVTVAADSYTIVIGDAACTASLGEDISG